MSKISVMTISIHLHQKPVKLSYDKRHFIKVYFKKTEGEEQAVSLV
jgi:hypothetical protein